MYRLEKRTQGDSPDMLWYSKEDWPEEMSLSSHKEWETGLWTSTECQGKSCTAGEIIEYYERRMEEIRKEVSR